MTQKNRQGVLLLLLLLSLAFLLLHYYYLQHLHVELFHLSVCSDIGLSELS